MFTTARSLGMLISAGLIGVLGMTATAGAQPLPNRGGLGTIGQQRPSFQPGVVRPGPSIPITPAIQPQRNWLPPSSGVAPKLPQPNGSVPIGRDWWKTYPWSPYNYYNPYNYYSPYYNPYYPYYPSYPYYPDPLNPWGNPYGSSGAGLGMTPGR